jgi:UDP-N-acetylglucosamine/UDP-N-acetylgalactosamine diphosphorylase
MQGCYDIGLPSNKSLFQLHAERLLKVQRLAAEAPDDDGNDAPSRPSNSTDCPAEKDDKGADHAVRAKSSVVWYVMTSPATHAMTVDFFTQSRFFGLDEGQVVFFQQGTLPCLQENGSPIVGPDGQVSHFASSIGITWPMLFCNAGL